jgi:hypothetical protein
MWSLIWVAAGAVTWEAIDRGLEVAVSAYAIPVTRANEPMTLTTRSRDRDNTSVNLSTT